MDAASVSLSAVDCFRTHFSISVGKKDAIHGDEEIEYRSEPWFADNKDQFKEMDWDMEIDRFHLNNEGLQESLGSFVKKFFS